MKRFALVLLLGVFVAGGRLHAAQTASDDEKPRPAKLVRKGATEADAATQDADRKPDKPVRTDDAPPPVVSEQGHDQGHEHANGELDEELLQLVQQLLEGEANEDAADQEQNPLLRIGRSMRDVENRIAQVDAGRETQTIQTSIIKDLDAMIKQLKNQASSCKNCNGAGCEQCQQLGSKRGQKPGQPNNSSKPGNNPRANTAATQAGTATPKQVAGQHQVNLLKEVWGHLPLRMREKLEQMSNERFLIKYDKLIESYFEALLERSDQPTN